MSTDGMVFSALSMANTDDKAFRLFLSELCKSLVKLDANFAANTVLLLDGATYHKSRLVREYIRRNKLLYMVSGPYSYQAAPAELYFSQLKRTNLNRAFERASKK